MSVDVISQADDPGLAGSQPAAPRAGASRHGRARPGTVRLPGHPFRPVADVLADGTPCYAPIGEVVIVDGSLVICHLCGRQLRSVTAHLKAHGWTKEAYCEAFGLERGQSLEGPQTRKLRAAAFTARLVFDPSIREGSAAGRDRARAGELARDAATAARGRRIPEQRRRKALRSLAAVSPVAVAQANSERARRRLAEVAATAARRAGHPDIRTLVLTRAAGGASLATISREAGLHKDWLSRHLGDVDPEAASAVRALQHERWDAGWRPGTEPARLCRRGRLPPRAAHHPALDRQRHRRRGRPVAPRGRVGAAPPPARPDRARRQASRITAARGRGGRRTRLRRHLRLPCRPPGRRMDLAGDRCGIGSARVLGPPAGRRIQPHRRELTARVRRRKT